MKTSGSAHSENARYNDSLIAGAFNRPASRNIRLTLSLLFITAATIVIMTVFQVAKTIFDPDLTVWESQVYTILFAGLVAPLFALFVLLRFEGLYQKIYQENEERKRAEEAVRKSEERYRDLVENVNDIVWQMDERYVFTYISQQIYNAWGYTPEEVIGKTPMNFMPPDEARRISRILEDDTAKRNKLYMFGNQQTRKDGGTVYLEVSGQPIIDKNGVYRGYRGTARDITERKRTEEALQESEEKFRVLAETSPAAIFLYQGENYVYVNPMAEVLTGYSRDELLAGDAWEWIHPECRELVKERARERQLGRKLPSQYEVKYHARDGREGWVDFAAGLIEYRGKPAGLAMAFDVTKRKRAEKELKASKEQVELYLDLMGHDINNMNQSAMGYLELVLQTLEADGKIGLDGKLFIEKPLKAIENSSRLIENVGKLQRLMTEGVETAPVDLHDVFEKLRAHDFRADDKDITINYGQVSHCVVEGSELLRDVFFNLISNAIKHSSPGRPVTVDVSVERVEEDGAFYRCAVEDNGPGIPDEMKPKVFHRFQRGKTKAVGKGLGLYIVRTLVEGYHGKVWVEDRVKGDHTKGARFVVMLPAVKN